MNTVKRSTNYQREVYATGGSNESNDCSVRAFATVACIPYEESHALFKKHGRLDFQATYGFITRAVIDEQFPENINLSGSVGDLTINQFVERFPVGHYMVHVNKHALAICDGVIHDWQLSLRKRINNAWRIV